MIPRPLAAGRIIKMSYKAQKIGVVVCDELYSTDNRCKDGRMAEALEAAGV